MSTWLLINGVLSLSLLLALPLLSGAPARLKLWLCLAAMLAWCLPLQPITIGDGAMPLLEAVDVVQIKSTAVEVSSAVAQRHWHLPQWSTVLWLSVLVGLIWFLRDWHQAQQQIRQWRRQSVPLDAAAVHSNGLDDIELRLVQDSDLAVTTGMLKPVVWIGDRWRGRSQWQVILTHELTHARRGDPRWLLLVQLLRRAFWWNPLVVLLARRAHQYIEWSCDEVCTRTLGVEHYTDTLLGHWQLRYSEPVAGLAFPFRSATVERIKRIQQETHMTHAHRLILALLAMITTVTLVQAGTTERSSTSVMQEDGGQIELEFENTSMDRFADVMTQITGLQVRIHPSLADEVISGSYRCTDTGCHKALLDLTPDDVSFRYAGNQIYVASEAILASSDESWLAQAINGQHSRPVPPHAPQSAQALTAPDAPQVEGQSKAVTPPAPPVRPGQPLAAPQPPAPPAAPDSETRTRSGLAPMPDPVPAVRPATSTGGAEWAQGLWSQQNQEQANC